MFAIIRSGGKQYRVHEGLHIDVDSIDVEEGSTVTIEDVLVVEDDDSTTVGTPLVTGSSVTATVLEHQRAKKVTFFHYKNKTRQKRTRGHRQNRTLLQINSIATGS